MDISEKDSLADIPEEFKNITLANAQFYKVSSPLEQLNGADPFKRHVMIVTSLGHLTELQEDQVLRFTRLEWKDVKKVLVHHEFQPAQLFVVLLRHNHIACLLSYSNLKILHEWPDILDISSVDPDGVGVPSLQITDTSGNLRTISLQLSSLSSVSKTSEKDEHTEKGKQNAASALAHRLKGGIKQVEQLNSQRRMKETFIKQKLSIIQSQLQGLNVSDDDTHMPALTVEEDDDDEDDDGEAVKQHSLLSLIPNVSLKIVSVRHKTIHDKWVIGLNVVNNSERMLVCNIQLMLHVSKGTDSLSYTTKILKVVQRRPPMNSTESTVKQSNTETKVTVERLDPPILRPKKRACILGICMIPDFTESSTVVCSGIVTFTSKTLNPESTQQLVSVKPSCQQFQLSFEPVELSAQELPSHHVVIEKNFTQTGVPFSSVTLVGGSVYNCVTFTSLVSPLSDLVSRLSVSYEITKVNGISDMYCFYPEKCHPLRFSAVTFLPVNSNNVKLGLYTRDDNQALILVHFLLAALPSDVCIQPIPTSSHSHQDQEENIRQQLFAKMKEAATYVMDGYETQVATSKKSSTGQAKTTEPGFSKAKVFKAMQSKNVQDEHEFDSEVYNNERKIISARKEDVTFNGNLYSEWRKKLYKIQSEMDDLYVRYLK